MKRLSKMILAGLTGVALMLPALPTPADAKDNDGYKHSRRDGDYRRFDGRHGRSNDHRFNRRGNYRRGETRHARFDGSRSGVMGTMENTREIEVITINRWFERNSATYATPEKTCRKAAANYEVTSKS